MNIKIKIEESNPVNVRATIYNSADTQSNVGTLWMTRKEFDQFVSMLTYGISEHDTVEVEDPSIADEYVTGNG